LEIGDRRRGLVAADATVPLGWWTSVIKASTALVWAAWLGSVLTSAQVGACRALKAGAENQVNIYLFVESMPFDGVGPAGLGHYYGRYEL
jgi:hypothetical protein